MELYFGFEKVVRHAPKADPRIRQLMADGFDEKTAKQKTDAELGLRVAEAGASGALMGAGFGAIGSAGGYLNHRAQNSETGRVLREQGRMEMMIDAALAKGDRRAPSYQLAAELQRELAAGKADDSKLGQLVYAIIEEGTNGRDAETTPAAQNAEGGIMLPRAGERGMLPGNETAAPRTGTAEAGIMLPRAGEQRRQYRIAETVDGQRFVDVDTDQSLFKGLTVSEMQKVAKNEIMRRFQGKVIGDTYTAYVRKRAAEHYAYPANRRMDQQQKADKMQAAPELDNILTVSTFRKNIPDDGRHPEATGGLDKLDTMFRVNGRMYQAEITALVTDRGRVFYDMTKFRDITSREVGQTPNGAAETASNASVDTLPQNAPAVNHGGIMLPMAGESRLARPAH